MMDRSDKPLASPEIPSNARPPIQEVQLPPMSQNVRTWAQDKRRSTSTSLKREDWNTKNLGSRIGADATAAGAAGILVAPIIAIIDKAIIENASNRATLFQSATSSIRTLLFRPHYFFTSRPFRLIFLLYTGTYMSANSLDTFASTTRRPPAASDLERYPPSHTTSGTAKFVATSTTNLTLCVYKDNQFTKLFGAASTRPVPNATLALYAVRDMLTVFASFNVPPLLAPRLSIPVDFQKYVSQASAAQFIAPAAVQVISTPLHLLGLDLYNRPEVNGKQRLQRVVRDWGKSCMARICRIVPAFGVGGVVNTSVRRSFMEKLE